MKLKGMTLFKNIVDKQTKSFSSSSLTPTSVPFLRLGPVFGVGSFQFSTCTSFLGWVKDSD